MSASAATYEAPTEWLAQGVSSHLSLEMTVCGRQENHSSGALAICQKSECRIDGWGLNSGRLTPCPSSLLLTKPNPWSSELPSISPLTVPWTAHPRVSGAGSNGLSPEDSFMSTPTQKCILLENSLFARESSKHGNQILADVTTSWAEMKYQTSPSSLLRNPLSLCFAWNLVTAYIS